ncbi:MAG TPA: helix-hairpin-helix domain-containing protein [Gemmatimonadales bacterium]|nr:helix-hairpin-helix domain-containing protein [Gemmatimonadales bacterium]
MGERSIAGVGADDRRAIGILLALLAAGLVVRFWPSATHGAPPGEVAFRPVDRRAEPDSIAARAARLARPLGRGERVDVDRAGAEDLVRLPRVGPGLAARIVEDREANGPFGSLEGLDRVSGVGPGLLAAVKPHVSFSGAPWRPGGSLSATGHALPGDDRGAGSGPPVRLNTASEAELAQIPGVGPARAAAIVADRKARGPFRSLAEVGRVTGIGPVTLERLKGRVRVP